VGYVVHCEALAGGIHLERQPNAMQKSRPVPGTSVQRAASSPMPSVTRATYLLLLLGAGTSPGMCMLRVPAST
jgi:hypothetical protein